MSGDALMARTPHSVMLSGKALSRFFVANLLVRLMLAWSKEV